MDQNSTNIKIYTMWHQKKINVNIVDGKIFWQFLCYTYIANICVVLETIWLKYMVNSFNYLWQMRVIFLRVHFSKYKFKIIFWKIYTTIYFQKYILIILNNPWIVKTRNPIFLINLRWTNDFVATPCAKRKQTNQDIDEKFKYLKHHRNRDSQV